MSDAAFQSFVVVGLLCLIGAIVFMAFQAWRWLDLQKDQEQQSLAGIGYELRLNLQRMIDDVDAVARGAVEHTSSLRPVSHPQLDAFLGKPGRTDRQTLSVIRMLYDDLLAHKLSIHEALAQGVDATGPVKSAVDSILTGLSTLYLWEAHKGKPPCDAPSTRSWTVRDWMKAHNFEMRGLPYLHLRDAVIERLRRDGMTLTPRPLTCTASEYYAKRYDRKADPNAPFWKRKQETEVEPEASEAA